MAWTAPKTWSVGELVTATNMNTHVRDNLTYLKGGAGAVNIEASLGVGAAGITPGASLHAKGTGGGNIQVLAESDSTGSSRIELRDGAGPQNKIALILGTASATDGQFGIYDARQSVFRALINTGGDLGLGTTSPQGRLHLRDTISGVLHWEYDGVDGTARTVIPDGAGDVLYGLTGLAVARASTGAAPSVGVFSLSALPSTYTLFNDGTNSLAFHLNANGSTDVQRAAGTATFKVAIWLLWL